MQWIRVEDGLPKDGDLVFLACRGLVGMGYTYSGASVRQWVFVRPNCHFSGALTDITHWAYIEPPQDQFREATEMVGELTNN